MSLPLFEEIEINEYSPEYLVRKFKLARVGSGPFYLTLPETLPEPKIYEVLGYILQALEKLEIHPFFPYPLYVIINKEIQYDGIPIIKKKEELPEHFIKKPKRLKPLEQELNHKAKLFADRVKNIPIQKRMEKIQDIRKEQKELFRICKELSFYQKLQKQLRSIKRKHE